MISLFINFFLFLNIIEMKYFRESKKNLANHDEVLKANVITKSECQSLDCCNLVHQCNGIV